MLHKSLKRKSAVMTMAIMFAAAPFALATDRPATAPSGQQSQPQYDQKKTGHTSTSSSSSMDMQDHQAITATVEEVNQQDSSLSLRLDDGNTVEMKVPEAMLSDLQQGDSVEVSIRKANDGQQSGMSGSQPSQSGSSGMTTTPQPKAGQMK